ncbi:MAG: hypothetical protein AAF787_00160 [Chloroflexota bacterium]
MIRPLIALLCAALFTSAASAEDQPVISDAAVAMLAKIDTVGLDFGTTSELALFHVYPQWGDGTLANITDWRFLYYELQVREMIGLPLINADGYCGVWLCLEYDRAQPGLVWYRVTITDAARGVIADGN